MLLMITQGTVTWFGDISNASEIDTGTIILPDVDSEDTFIRHSSGAYVFHKKSKNNNIYFITKSVSLCRTINSTTPIDAMIEETVSIVPVLKFTDIDKITIEQSFTLRSLERMYEIVSLSFVIRGDTYSVILPLRSSSLTTERVERLSASYGFDFRYRCFINPMYIEAIRRGVPNPSSDLNIYVSLEHILRNYCETSYTINLSELFDSDELFNILDTKSRNEPFEDFSTRYAPGKTS